MKELTSSIYTFEKMIRENFLYVDKTEYLWELIRPGSAMYFYSRPRRFGKSLTLSTLEAVFQGKKELFRGLALYEKPYDWKSYPIIHLDFGDLKNDSVEALEKSLHIALSLIASRYGIPLGTNDPQMDFHLLTVKLAEQGPVVILIDEYDKPILDNLLKPDVAKIQTFLSNFYSVVKTTERYQRFVFMTGVSKFSHVSVFSKLNNLRDITMDAKFAAMLGYTQEELEFYFGDRIEQLIESNGGSKAEMLQKIKSWYNGYRFHAKNPTVYNPVSLVQFFNNGGEFNNYWFKTGTPTFLLEMMKQSNFNYADSLSEPEGSAFFDSFEISRIKPKVLLYQTGYLTLDRCEQEKMPYSDETITNYYLHFPNREVEKSFNENLLEYYANLQTNESQRFFAELIQMVGSGIADGFMESLKRLFANIPYNIHVKSEHYYQTIFYVICDMLHFYVQAEICTNAGRIDMMVAAGEWIYVLEFKLNHTAEDALKQIKNKEYALKYKRENKRIMLIGVNFDFDKGQISDWLTEELL